MDNKDLDGIDFEELNKIGEEWAAESANTVAVSGSSEVTMAGPSSIPSSSCSPSFL